MSGLHTFPWRARWRHDRCKTVVAVLDRDSATVWVAQRPHLRNLEGKRSGGGMATDDEGNEFEYEYEGERAADHELRMVAVDDMPSAVEAWCRRCGRAVTLDREAVRHARDDCRRRRIESTLT